MFRLLKLLLSPKTVLGMMIGAAAAWFSDPERGPERRAQALAALKERAPGAVPPAPSHTTPLEADRTTEPNLWTPGDTTTESAAS